MSPRPEEEIHVGDIGTVFETEVMKYVDGELVAMDVSSATDPADRRMRFKKPDGTVVDKEAVFSGDGTDGLLRYVSVGGDLDADGDWRRQCKVVLTNGTWHTTITNFKVHPNIEP